MQKMGAIVQWCIQEGKHNNFLFPCCYRNKQPVSFLSVSMVYSSTHALKNICHQLPHQIQWILLLLLLLYYALNNLWLRTLCDLTKWWSQFWVGSKRVIGLLECSLIGYFSDRLSSWPKVKAKLRDPHKKCMRVIKCYACMSMNQLFMCHLCVYTQ